MSCPICGAVVPSSRGHLSHGGNAWLSKAVLLHCSKLSADAKVLEIPVVRCGSRWRREKNQAPGSHNLDDLPAFGTYDSDGLPAYYYLHAKCLDIVTRVIASRNSGIAVGKDGVRSIEQLFIYFHGRYRSRVRTAQPTTLSGFHSLSIFPDKWQREPHGYYGAQQAHDDFWQPDLSQAERQNLPTLQQYQVQPFPIDNMTLHILSFLKPLPNVANSGAAQPSTLATQLPREILDLIIENLMPLHDLPLLCTRVFPPSFWRQGLFHYGMLPYLWDMNPEELAERRSTADPPYAAEDEWDWELLVRQLAQVRVFEGGNLMGSAHLGLRNRRRIWRLVEEMKNK